MTPMQSLAGALTSALIITTSAAQSPKYKADVPASITTPDTVQTRIGTLKFSDGLPDAETVKKVYDNLDFYRGVEAFMAGMPAASIQALKMGFTEAGFPPNEAIGITEDLADARALFLTPNTAVVYVWCCVDVKDTPMVLQVPPGVLGLIDDAYFRHVFDVGFTGVDQGKGGKYLLVGPDHKGPLPAEASHVAGDGGHVVQKMRTYNNLVIMRSFVKDGDVAATVKNVKDHLRLYPLSAAANPPAQKFVNISGKKFNTVHANDAHFYDELSAVVQHEPADFVDPETVGLFASIGIKKGKPFAPDARMKAILVESAAVGNATTRALVFAPRDERAKFFPDRQWYTTFILNSYQFLDGAERLLDARTMFYYYATGNTPAMVLGKPGIGSTYAIAARDSGGNYFDGAKTYKVTLPAPIPAARFWSFNVYDNQHRSFLETDQKLAGLDSTLPGIKANADGSVTVWFGPTAPPGQEHNWVQTRAGKGWNALFRLYGPLEPWINKTWKPGDLERID